MERKGASLALPSGVNRLYTTPTTLLYFAMTTSSNRGSFCTVYTAPATRINFHELIAVLIHDFKMNTFLI